MPEFLADGFPVNTQDVFVDELTLGPAADVRSISFSVLGNNAVTVQAWRYLDPSKTKWILEPFTRVFAGQSVGVVVRNCAGIRFANATAGKTSLVVAELDYDSDVDLSGGSITSATIDGSGNITPAPSVAITRTILASGAGTYQTPAGCRAILVECVGGGGGGGGTPAVGSGQWGAGAGGGGGGYAASLIESPAAAYSYSVGGGGAGVVGGTGGAGGTTNFGAGLVEAGGGVGGVATGGSSLLLAAGGAGGSGIAGDLQRSGQPGNPGLSLASGQTLGGNGGMSAIGGGGGQGNRNGLGQSGQGEGGGGGAAGVSAGSSGAQPGAAGSPGVIVITELY